MSTGNTFLEDALDRISAVPAEVRRLFDLVRRLDDRWGFHMAELKKLQDTYVENVKAKVKGQPRDGSVDLRAISEDKLALEKIAALQKLCIQLADEKVATVNQAYDTLDLHIKKLGSDLKAFEGELRATGQYEALVGSGVSAGGGDEDGGSDYGDDEYADYSSHANMGASAGAGAIGAGQKKGNTKMAGTKRKSVGAESMSAYGVSASGSAAGAPGGLHIIVGSGVGGGVGLPNLPAATPLASPAGVMPQPGQTPVAAGLSLFPSQSTGAGIAAGAGGGISGGIPLQSPMGAVGGAAGGATGGAAASGVSGLGPFGGISLPASLDRYTTAGLQRQASASSNMGIIPTPTPTGGIGLPSGAGAVGNKGIALPTAGVPLPSGGINISNIGGSVAGGGINLNMNIATGGGLQGGGGYPGGAPTPSGASAFGTTGLTSMRLPGQGVPLPITGRAGLQVGGAADLTGGLPSPFPGSVGSDLVGGADAGGAEPESYCVCGGPSHPADCPTCAGNMVGCENKNCKGGEWFHLECMGMTKAPSGKWYCPTCQAGGAGGAGRGAARKGRK